MTYLWELIQEQQPPGKPMVLLQVQTSKCKPEQSAILLRAGLIKYLLEDLRWQISEIAALQEDPTESFWWWARV